eukprot:GCRY01000951.1.p1 GENE.GCRY01000951.1~~GCRY01000951.1.p1  ORF type:complete len:153 (+),score=8.51 GCRY01000951.1:189-647(+)
MFHFFLLISRQGKTRLTKWFSPYTQKQRTRILRDSCQMVLNRRDSLCNFLEYKNKKLVYKRYASLYFVACVDATDNELLALETLHMYVEILDRYFGNVCELDIIFNFHKAYFMLDELLLGGEQQETSKKAILRVIAAADALQESPDGNQKEL